MVRGVRAFAQVTVRGTRCVDSGSTSEAAPCATLLLRASVKALVQRLHPLRIGQICDRDGALILAHNVVDSKVVSANVDVTVRLMIRLEETKRQPKLFTGNIGSIVVEVEIVIANRLPINTISARLQNASGDW